MVLQKNKSSGNRSPFRHPRGRVSGAFLCVLVAALAVLPGGCTRGGKVSRGTLRVRLWNDPVSLDPAAAEDGVGIRVLGAALDGLVGYDGAGNLRSRIAESWTISPDGRRYRFELRPGARWSDGKAVTAAEFVAGFRRALSPASA
jgi:oligopeptide transport system substrate-binding protein